MAGRYASAPGQSVAEFAIAAVVLFGLIFGVFDFARLAFDQHSLAQSADDLARALATVSATNTSSSPGDYTPTTLSATSVATAYAHAASLSQRLFPSTALSASGPLDAAGSVLTNGTVTVGAFPTLAAPQVITVTAQASFTAVSPFIHGFGMHLSATAQSIPPAGQ